MRLRNILEPSARDFEIYHAFVSDDVEQQDLAEQHGISQPRISQIIAKTKQWISTGLPGQRTSESPEQDVVVATYTRLHEVKRRKGFAAKMHEEQLKAPPDGAKRSKPDPRWNKQADDLAERTYQVELLLSTACHAAQAKLMKDLAHREDKAVVDAIEDAEELHATAQRMIEEGLIEPFDLPAIDKRAIEICVRNVSRLQTPNRTLATHATLPPEWQEVSHRLFTISGNRGGHAGRCSTVGW